MTYFVLRACERLNLSEAAFFAADYDTQLRWLAYDAVRRAEEASRFEPQPGTPR